MQRNALYPSDLELLVRVLNTVAGDKPLGARSVYAARLIFLYQAGVTEEGDLVAALQEYRQNAGHLAQAS